MIYVIIYVGDEFMRMYKPAVVSVLLGVSVKTLQRWDKSGKLVARRTPTNKRYYTKEDLDNYKLSCKCED